MRNELLKWLGDKESFLHTSHIITDWVNLSTDVYPNPSLTVDHISEKGLGRIIIWESGELDLEIIHPDTEDQLLFEHYLIEGPPDFDLLLVNYFNALISTS